MVGILLMLCAVSSCRAAGRYVEDRSLDFLDQYRLVVGAGTVAGVRAQAWGIYDTGLLVGLKPKSTALGWRYGAPLFFDAKDPRMDADQAQLVTTCTTVGLDISDGSYVSAWNSFALFPAIFTRGDATPTDFDWEVPEEGRDFEDRSWLWSPRSFARNRYAQIHAFDVEFEVALGVYLDTGFSPGELADFLLGLLTIDLAGDDGRL